jgi:hypothetical protein
MPQLYSIDFIRTWAKDDFAEVQRKLEATPSELKTATTRTAEERPSGKIVDWSQKPSASVANRPK